MKICNWKESGIEQEPEFEPDPEPEICPEKKRGEMTPDNIIKSVKFWNYLTMIISAKNKSCPRFPLVMTDLERLYNQKFPGCDDKIKLTRDDMVDLTVDHLQKLTDIIDDYDDKPIWKKQITDVNGGVNDKTDVKIQGIIEKDTVMGGKRLFQ